LHCSTLTHRDAPVSVRERLALSGAELDAVLDRAAAERGTPQAPAAEVAILSTCYRVEIYAAAPSPPADALAEWFAAKIGLDPDVPRPPFRRLADGEVIRHLFRVAAGLDSMVLGESEILGQVAAAGEAARLRGAAGPLLSRLFRAAVRAGKRVRRETAIGRNPASVSSAAVALAAALTGDLEGRSLVVIGAGPMARKAVAALRRRGVGRIVVVNRTPDAAATLAAEWGPGAEARGLDQLGAVLPEADIVISSTGAPEPIISVPVLRAALAGRRRPLVVIDIAVPRDVAPAAADLSGLHLLDLDRLQGWIERGAEARRAEAPRAEAIVAVEAERFEAERPGEDGLPIVAELRREADALRREELRRLLSRLPQADAGLAERLDRFSRALTNRLLHRPTERLRAEAGNGRSEELARVTRELFGLESPDR
jgi:glutamyl-tRNA reductase